MDILANENYLKDDKDHRLHKFEYLHNHEPKKMIQFYIDAFKNTRKYEDTIFDKEIGIKLLPYQYARLWDHIKENINNDTSYNTLSDQLENVLINQILYSDNNFVSRICYAFIMTSDLTNTQFGKKVIVLMDEAKSTNDFNMLQKLLDLYSRMRGFDLDTYAHYMLYYEINKNDLEERVN